MEDLSDRMSEQDGITSMGCQRPGDPLPPLRCLKCGQVHGLGHCLDFQTDRKQPTLDEAMDQKIKSQ